MDWRCDLCFPGSVEVGIIGDGYSLMLHEGKYHIVGGQGHKGDIILTFPIKPYPDPDPECENDDIDDSWIDAASLDDWKQLKDMHS